MNTLSSKTRIIIWVISTAAVISAAAVLFFVDPSDKPLIPCPIHTFTGIYCFTCGLTRSLYYLMHFMLAEAHAMNTFVIPIMALYLAVYALLTFYCFNGRLPVFIKKFPLWPVIAFVLVAVVFTVLRNIPTAPFTLLAPHQL